jgi:hypothetical protein
MYGAVIHSPTTLHGWCLIKHFGFKTLHLLVVSCKISCSESDTAEDSRLLECDTVLLGEQFWHFEKSYSLHLQGSNSPIILLELLYHEDEEITILQNAWEMHIQQKSVVTVWIQMPDLIYEISLKILYLRDYTGCAAPTVVCKHEHFITMNTNMMKANTDLIRPNCELKIAHY